MCESCKHPNLIWRVRWSTKATCANSTTNKTHADVDDVWAFHVWFCWNRKQSTSHVCVCCASQHNTTQSFPSDVVCVWSPHTCHSSSLHSILGGHVGKHQQQTCNTHQSLIQPQWHHIKCQVQTQHLTHTNNTCRKHVTTTTPHAQIMQSVMQAMDCEATNNGQVMWSDEHNTALTSWSNIDARDARTRCFVLRWAKMFRKPSGTAESDSDVCNSQSGTFHMSLTVFDCGSRVYVEHFF